MATDQKQKDKAIIMALLNRFNEIRLPQAKAFQEKLARGEVLGDFEMSIIQGVREDRTKIWPLLQRNPEYLDLVEEGIKMWDQILEKNEENRKKKKKFTS